MLLQRTASTSTSRALAKTFESDAVASKLNVYLWMMLFVHAIVGQIVRTTLVNLLRCEVKPSIVFEIRWSKTSSSSMCKVTFQHMRLKYFSK